jgi:hypothetical protein
MICLGFTVRLKRRSFWNAWRRRQADVFAWIPVDTVEQAEAIARADMDKRGYAIEKIDVARDAAEVAKVRRDWGARAMAWNASRFGPAYQFLPGSGPGGAKVAAPASRSSSQAETPLLRQFGALTLVDFEAQPVWIGCHTVDSDAPWYDQTDEETFRPRKGELPAGPSEGMLLVRASATLRDGTCFAGFLTPAFEEGDLGTIQPQLFAGERRFSFWGGVPGVAREDRDAFYAAVERGADAVFPIRFAADPGLTTGVSRAEVDGFYKTEGLVRAKVVIEV